ncbi:cyclin [Trypanosoma grayi]|uniref:cyclin n=1 Tax=Trypanosoma grayi TaxID=71804 RepID=UPI0004F4AFCA|nr:cyclin [Trypanosoma grayi]KEG09415.1 cyclin [Trypanosoma grayi]
MAAEMNIRTTITADSVQRIFGPPASIDYRSHPGDEETVSPAVIFESMKQKEIGPLDDIRKLKGTVYSYKNRKVITHWLRDVCAAFDLKSTTLCLSVQLTDAFITKSLESLALEKCQLAAVTCLWVAAKFEEMDDSLPTLRKIVEVCDNAYTSKDVVDMEETILGFFKWRLPHTTVINHLYLQLHLLSSNDLIKCSKRQEETETNYISFKILLMGTDQWTWGPLEAAANSKLSDVLPLLCAAARLCVSHNIEVFQVFGENLLVTKRTPLSATLGSLPIDEHGETRLFLSNGHVNLVFVDRGSYIILRTINQRFLDLSELLIQEVVTHVEFMQLRSHVTALGVLTLTMCILATDLEECRAAISYVQRKLCISESQALAAARLLCTKYQEAMPTYRDAVAYSDVPHDISDRLKLCLACKTG